MQEARQVKSLKEEHITTSLRYTPFDVVILHDVNIPPKKMDAVRAALAMIYKSDINLAFKEIEFNQEQRARSGPPPN